MSNIIRLTESQLKDLMKSIVSEAKNDDNFIQKSVDKSEKKGTKGKFGEWCKDHGFGEEVSIKCINKAMKSEDSGVVKMANFAKNIGGYKGAKH